MKSLSYLLTFIAMVLLSVTLYLAYTYRGANTEINTIQRRLQNEPYNKPLIKRRDDLIIESANARKMSFGFLGGALILGVSGYVIKLQVKAEEKKALKAKSTQT